MTTLRRQPLIKAMHQQIIASLEKSRSFLLAAVADIPDERFAEQPPGVPNHIRPRLSCMMHSTMCSLDTPAFRFDSTAGRGNAVNVFPSNRLTPPNVPIQSSPCRSMVTLQMSSCASPCSVVYVVT